MATIDVHSTNNEYGSLSIAVNESFHDDYGHEDVYNGEKIAKGMIGAALQKHIRAINPHECEDGAEDTFFVADIGEVYRQHMRWKQHLGL